MIRTGPWPNNSLDNKLPPNSDVLWNNSASSRSPPTHLKPKVESSAPGAPVRTAWSANFASLKPLLWNRPTPCSLAFARPPADAASDFRRWPRRFDLARCLSLHYQRVVAPDHTVTLGAHSIALPPLPGQRGYAGETVELSHQLDGTLRVFRGDALLIALPRTLEEHAERRPVHITSAQKRKTSMPRIYKLSGRPALAAVT